MHKRGERRSRESPLVAVQDLVLDPRIDNSAPQSLSFYSAAPVSPPYPRHIFSPLRTESGNYNLSRELRSRFQQLDDSSKFTDTLSAGKDTHRTPLSPLSPLFAEGSIETDSLPSASSGMNAFKQSGLDIESKLSPTQKSPKSDKSSPKLKPKKYAAMANLSVRYHNMGNWPAESREPRAAILMVKINEEVIFREAVLEALQSALAVMDKRYWQYCVERIKATEANRTINSETLITLRNHLFEAQKHVAVLIAHARSLAIELIEKVKQLRHLHARNVKTAAVVSIYWKNENYLLKIKNDMEFINQSPTVRLWLGFAARELVIPPHSAVTSLPSSSSAITHTVNPHDPKAHWLRTHRQIYKDWFKKHEAYIVASWKSGKSKVIFKPDRKFLTADARAHHGHVPPISLTSPPQTPGFTPGITPRSGAEDSSTDHSRQPSAAATGRAASKRPTPPVSASSGLPPGAAGATIPAVDSGVPQIEVLGTTATVGDVDVHHTHHQQQQSPVHKSQEETIVAGLMEQMVRIICAQLEGSQDFTIGGIDASLSYSGDFSHPDLGMLPRGNSEFFDLLREDADGETEEDSRLRASSESLVPEQTADVTKGSGSDGQAQDMVGIAMMDKEGSQVTSAPAGPVTVSAVSAAASLGSAPVPSTSSGSSDPHHKDVKSGRKTPSSSGLAEGSTATVDLHAVPEWQQLRDYVQHSWGVMEVDEEVNEANNAFADYRRGFSNQKHGINDSHDGLADSKHPVSGDYRHGFTDARRGINDPVVGFNDSLAGVANKERVIVYAQGRAAAPMFWKTVDHNPLVVEAATGFEECFPTIYLVPPMPADLLIRAEKCAILLHKEYAAEQAILAQRAHCEEYKQSVLSSLHASSQETLLTESQLFKSAEDGAMLKLRQQGTTELLTGVSLQHLSNSLSLDAGSLSSLMVPSTSQILAKQRSMQNDSAAALEQSTDNVFLTNSLEQGDSQQLHSKLPEESMLFPNVQSFGGYVDTSGFKSFRIEECSKLRQRIEEKITDARKIVEYKDGDIFPTIRPEKKGLREPDHDSTEWQARHVVVLQCVIRRFLSRRRALKLRVAAAFSRSAHKVRTLVIGFMWRYRQRQKFWEARFEAFMMRKMAVKRFRASMTLAAFFRKIVRARRQMREDDARAKLLREGGLPTEKGKQRMSFAASAYTPISRNVRRKHGQVLVDDIDTTHSYGSPGRRASRSSSPTKTRVTTASTAAADSDSAAGSAVGSESPERAAAQTQGRHVTISNDVTQISVPNTPAPTSGVPSAPSSRGTEASAATVSATSTSNHRFFDSPQKKLTPSERLRSLEAPGPYEESKRREQLRNEALSLVARVNRGKIQADTLHNCRLVPTQSVPNLPATQARMRKFSTYEYAFLNVPNQPPPQSLIKSSSDVFVGPIPKRVSSGTSSSSTPRLHVSQSLEALHGSASASALTSTSSAATEHSAAHPQPGGMRGIDLPRGSSFSAFNTPHTSGKLAQAGASILSSASTASIAFQGTKTRSSASGAEVSAKSSPESTPGKAAQLGNHLHFGEVKATPGSAGHGGVAPLLKYNSTGLTLRSKKQQEAHDKAEAERTQLRNALLKYM